MMFAYSDPTRTGFLQQAGVLQAYREKVFVFDQKFGALAKSGFTRREAFEELTPGTAAEVATVDWKAFPVTAPATPEQIDGNRFRFQDEYVEWRVETKPDNSLAQLTITTEFSEYFEVIAQAGSAALKQEIQNLYPGANPTDQELFGAGFNPATATPNTRGDRFLQSLEDNPWNNGQKGILCLTQQFNTLGALFNLLGQCGVPKPNMDPGNVCANVGGACGPGRNSDPRVCTNAQTLARGDRSFSLQDPAGIRILRLDGPGLWTVDGQAVDINDEAANKGVWRTTRNHRRAVFSFQRDVRFAGTPIRTGAQLSNLLFVGADVIHAPNAALPEWARAGNEQMRVPIP
jgi:hypothetical protein